jgi:M6 family metalloprotease-like protein
VKRFALIATVLVALGALIWRLNVLRHAAENRPTVQSGASPAGARTGSAGTSPTAAVAANAAASLTNAGTQPSAAELQPFTYAQAWTSPQPTALAEFRDWAVQYQRAATVAERTALEPAGIALARARRPVMRALIESEPKTAFAVTIPAEIRALLPAAIVAELETRFSIRGEFSVLAIDYRPEELTRRRAAGLSTESFQRFVIMDGREVDASIYGRRMGESSKSGIPLHGVMLDKKIALHESAVRVLEPAENSVPDLSGGIAAQVGGKFLRFASAEELVQTELEFEAAEKGLGPVPLPMSALDGGPVSTEPIAIGTTAAQATTAWTVGNKKVLIIRIDFFDFPGNPFRSGTTYTATYVQNLADTQVSPYYVQSSYGQTSITNTVTTQLYRMPQSAAYYATGGTTGLNTQLHTDAQELAASHYTLANYDRIVVLFRDLGSSAISGSKMSYAGLGQVGSKRIWLNGEFDFRVLAHELGHTYGLFHANLWQVTDGNTVSASGTSTEYGDVFDTMGANLANDPHSDFNPWFKNLLGWAADNQVQSITTSGTYRVNRFDNTTGTGTLALKVIRDSTRNYWIGIRRNFTSNVSMQSGAYVIWGATTNQQSNLLDVTSPGTSEQDAALAVGATLTDTVGNVSIKTLTLGGSTPNEYADIQVVTGLNGLPVISSHPQRQAFSIGDSATFSVTATGAAPLSYQWRKNAVDIPSATGSTYSIVSAQLTDVGSYSVRVSNGVGSTTSNSASLVINAPPAISTPPRNFTVAAGLPAVFGVGVLSGPTPTYQWRRNGSNLATATTSSLLIDSAAESDAGSYDVLVANSFGHAVSVPATLTVKPDGSVPSNNNFATAWALPGNLGMASGTNIGATLEVGEPTHYTGGGSGGLWNAVWFRWTPSVSGVAQIDTIGSVGATTPYFDTVLAVYTGSSVAALTKLAQDDDSGSATSHTSKVSINVTAGTTYSIAVGGFESDDIGFVRVNYAVQAVPAIVAPPVSRVVVVGSPATFTLSAMGLGPLAYQWKKNEQNIPGAVGSSLTISNTTLAMSGDQFRCLITNSTGSTESAVASLGVNAASTVMFTSSDHAIFNPSLAGSFAVTATGTPAPTFSVISGTFPAWATLNATTGQITGTPPNATGAPFNFTLRADNGVGAPETQSFTLDVVVVPAITAFPSARQIVALGGSLTLNATVSGFPAVSYLWKHNGRPIAGATGNAYVISGAKARDAGWYQLFVTNSAGSATSAVVFVSITANPAQLFAWGDNSNGETVVPAGLNAVLSMTAGGQHNVVVKPDGTIVTWGRNETVGAVATPVAVTDIVSVAGGGIHTLALRSNGTVVAWGYNGSGQATVPAGLSNVVKIAAGGSHSLAVKADGTVIGWGLNGDGQSSVPDGLTGVISVAAGQYHSVAVKADGTVVSWGYNSHGQGVVPAGVSDVVDVAAGQLHNVALKSNGAVMAWGYNGSGESTVPGGLTNVIQITAGGAFNHALKADGTIVSWGDNGFGQAAVPANIGNVVQLAAGGSHTVALTSPAPAITTAPQSQTINVGQIVTFSVVASGTAPFTYQWRKGSANILNATSPTFTINNAQTSDAGSYDVVVGNASGTTTSSAATLTVLVPATIVTQPSGATIPWGQTVTLTAAGAGSAPLVYQWYQGTSPNTAVPMSGANAASFTTSALNATTSYWVRVSNAAGSANSATATVNVGNFTPTVAFTSETGPSYSTTGGTATVRVRVTYTGQTPNTIGVNLALPPGWTFASYAGPAAASTPSAGDTALAWTFSTFPANELTFTFNAAYPADLTGNRGISGSVTYGSPEVSVPLSSLTFTPSTPPIIITQPASRAAGVDVGVTFTVVASGTMPLNYQWRKNGANIPNDSRIGGSTTASLAIAAVTTADAGTYTVVVNNAVGSDTSNDAALAVVDARATHTLVGRGYTAGGAIAISNTITYAGVLSGLGWSVIPPDGWSYAAGAGSEGEMKPGAGATSLLEWAWTTIPVSPITFTYILNVPAGTTGAKTIVALLFPRHASVQFQTLVRPDPLLIDNAAYHSADTNRDMKFSLTELLRVIELYNTRNGTVRTGAYAVDASNMEDGFATEPARANSAVVTLAKYHSADSDHDGKLSLTELLRVIELYNFRSGTVRTGEYRVLVGSEDGFAAGP